MLSLTPLELLSIQPAELERLHSQHGAGLTEAQLSQTRVPLMHLRVAPAVFQPRIAVEERWNKSAHIRSLFRAAKQNDGHALTPILVFPVAGCRIIVDGHCRAVAYQRIDRSQRWLVPVRYLKGTFREALSCAASGNSRDKLALTQREKAQMAWRIVCYEEGRADLSSTRKIEADTGCSRSLVSVMRQLLGAHPKPTEGMTDTDPRMQSWREAQRVLHPKLDESSRDAWEEKWSADVSTKLRATFGAKPDKQPVLFLDAIRTAYPSLDLAIDDEIAMRVHKEEAEKADEGETSPF
jgi:hypothetical protein